MPEPSNPKDAKELLFKTFYGTQFVRLFKNPAALINKLIESPLSKLQNKKKSIIQGDVYGLLNGEKPMSDDFVSSLKALVVDKLSTATDVDANAVSTNIIMALQEKRCIQRRVTPETATRQPAPIMVPALSRYNETMRFTDNAYVIAKHPLEFLDRPNKTVQEMINMHTRILSRYGDEKSTKAEGAPELFYFLPERGNGADLWKRIVWRLKEYASRDSDALQRMALYSGNKDSVTKRAGDIVVEHLQKCNEEGYIRVFDDLGAGGYFITDHVVCNPGDMTRMDMFYYKDLEEHKLSEFGWKDRWYWNEIVLEKILRDTVSGKNEVSCKDVFGPHPQ